MMPKMKSHSGAKKRFKVSATGKLMRRQAFRSHLLTGKRPKRKRRLARPAAVDPSMSKRIRQLLP